MLFVALILAVAAVAGLLMLARLLRADYNQYAKLRDAPPLPHLAPLQTGRILNFFNAAGSIHLSRDMGRRLIVVLLAFRALFWLVVVAFVAWLVFTGLRFAHF